MCETRKIPNKSDEKNVGVIFQENIQDRYIVQQNCLDERASLTRDHANKPAGKRM